MRRIRAGILAISSGVRPSGSGSSAGSPSASRPSGSSLAARWPWVRWALSSEVAACTAPSSSSSGTVTVGRRRCRPRRCRCRRRGWRELGQLRPEVAEHGLVEAVLALEVGLDPLQEAARLGALDDPVVVGRGHRHDLLGADQRPDARRVRPGRRSNRWPRSSPAPSSGAEPRRRCRSRRDWSA